MDQPLRLAAAEVAEAASYLMLASLGPMNDSKKARIGQATQTLERACERIQQGVLEQADYKTKSDLILELKAAHLRIAELESQRGAVE